MKIEELLDRYFEGQTSCEEERQLRRFFTTESIPEHLQVYHPLFACLEQEAKDFRKKDDSGIKKPSVNRRFLYTLGAVAAGVLLLIGIAGTHQYLHHSTPENFVIIDGKQYTDAKLIQEQALAAFHDMKTTEDEMLNLMFE